MNDDVHQYFPRHGMLTNLFCGALLVENHVMPIAGCLSDLIPHLSRADYLSCLSHPQK